MGVIGESRMLRTPRREEEVVQTALRPARPRDVVADAKVRLRPRARLPREAVRRLVLGEGGDPPLHVVQVQILHVVP